MAMNRRTFLRKSTYYGLGAASFGAWVETLNLTTALAQTGGPADYKALVCIFMFGGNDANNMVVPLSSGPYGGYNTYATLRNNLAMLDPNAATPNKLLPLKGGANVAANQGTLGSFGFHPSFDNPNLVSGPVKGLRELFDQNRLAVITNVGPLKFPLPDYGVSQMPKQAYATSSKRPFSLYAHNEQQLQWRSARADIPLTTGWGGRLADRTDPGTTALPQVISIAGKDTFTIGTITQPLSIGTGALNGVLNISGFGSSETARRTAFDFLRTADRNNLLVAATSDIMSQAVAVDAALNVDPAITTVFPNTSLGNQLKQVAKVIKANLQQPLLGLRRQVFFVSMGGFDTHQNELTGQGGGLNAGALVRGLFGQLNDAMVAFYNCLGSGDFIGQSNIPADIRARVTAFTHSDFSRTFDPAQDNLPDVGTDHAWGSHQFVMGDAVLGGKFYGVIPGTGSLSTSTGTIFQDISKLGNNNLNDTTTNHYDTGNRGLFVPTVSVEQMANTLATWYGLTDPADKAFVFPLLSRFQPATLGFMA